jgi:hypothetical protein
MIKLKELLTEALDYPYKYSRSFKTELIDYEDPETGETYKKDVLKPVQLVKFKTDEGVPYLWYARQNRYDGTIWEIAFGIEKVINYDDDHYQIDIGVTGTGNALRIFATVVDIINSFVEFDEDNYEIQRLLFTAKGDKRSDLYINRLVPRIEKFKVESIRDNGGGEKEVMLIRQF